MLRTSMLPFAASSCCLAQSAAAWTLDEATMAAVLPTMVHGDLIPGLENRSSLGAYRFDRLRSPDAADPGDATYAWPTGDSLRTFAMTDRGTVMFTEDRPQPYDKDKTPAWNAIVGKGSEPRLDQALVLPGRGSDDQMWQPVSMVRHVTSAVTVRTEDGKPVAGVTVVVGPKAWFARASCVELGEEPRAVGLAFCDAQGRAVLRSVPATGACLGLAVAQQLLRIRLRLDADKDGLHVVVDGAEVSAMQSSCANADEHAAIATLRNIASAQRQGKASSGNDANRNGQGEYSFLAQLSGVARLQTPAAPGVEVKFVPPVLSRAFANVRSACVARNGYLFQIYLPGRSGWVAEAANGGADGVEVDAARAETMWCAYAWPMQNGVTGSRAFYIDAQGDVLATSAAVYEGRDKRPTADAAQLPGSATATPAANQIGADGNRWLVVW